MATESKAGPVSLDDAYRYCLTVTRQHYENFPVASLFIPAVHRPHIAAIYAFARAADDVADEGSLSAAERLDRLDEWENELNACYEGSPRHPVFVALADAVRRHSIPREHFLHLLAAFRSDIRHTRYRTFGELLEYCENSANPIGRLVLTVFGDLRQRICTLSDRICTALQLANFWQDVAADWKKGRIYLPLDDMERFGYTEHDLQKLVVDDRLRRLMEFEVLRTREMFVSGRSLLEEITPDLRFEVNITFRGGMAILDEIERAGFDVLQRRPVLSPLRKASIAVSAALRKRI